jgi:peroxiredoxin
MILLSLTLHLNFPRPLQGAGREGEILPFFKAQDVSGQEIDLRSLARQNTVVILFWNSYKTMAIREINFLNDMYRYYQVYGLEVVAIEGGGKEKEGVLQELEKLAIIGTEPEFAVLPDPGGRLFRQYRISEIPESFLLNRGGKVLYHLQGFRDSDAPLLERQIKDVLGLLPAPSAAGGPGGDRGLAAPKKPPSRLKGVTVDPERQLYEKYLYFGNYHFNLGEMDKALENYSRCVEIDTRATEVYLKIGEIYARRKEYEQAREAWESVLKYDPDNEEADGLIRRLVRGEF